MKKILKFGVVPAVVFILLLCATVMLLPSLINVQKFLPQIEQQISQRTGRTFHIGADFGLTFFPWLSVTFSDAHLGNPSGITPADFVTVGSLEARVKLLPLLFNRVEVSRFIVSGLEVNLMREEDGGENWKGILAADGAPGGAFWEWLSQKDLKVDLFAVTGGELTFVDKEKKKELKLDDIMLMLSELSALRKATAEFKIASAGHVIKGGGTIGPLPEHSSSLSMDLHLQLDEAMKAGVKGECSTPLTNTQCDLAVSLPSFTAADLFRESGAAKEAAEEDLRWGKSISVEGLFHGNGQKFAVDNGTGTIDGNNFTFNMAYNREDETPSQLEVHFTKFDITPYFRGNDTEAVAQGGTAASSLMRTLISSIFSARVEGEEVQLYDFSFINTAVELQSGNGSLDIEDGVFELCGGRGVFSGNVNIDGDSAILSVTTKAQDMHSDEFSKSLIGKAFLTGIMQGNITYEYPGQPESELGDSFLAKADIELYGGTLTGMNLFAGDDALEKKTTVFNRLEAELVAGSKAANLQSLMVDSVEGRKEMHGVIDLHDKTFKILPKEGVGKGKMISLAGGYGPDGITRVDYSDTEETSIPEVRDVQTIVNAQLPTPSEEDVENIQGTSLIDPAVVAQRFGLKRELISQTKVKKTFKVGQGRVVIHPLKQLESVNSF